MIIYEVKYFEQTICVTPDKEIAKGYYDAMIECGNDHTVLDSYETDFFRNKKCFRIEIEKDGYTNIDLIGNIMHQQYDIENEQNKWNITNDHETYIVYANTANEAKIIADKIRCQTMDPLPI